MRKTEIGDQNYRTETEIETENMGWDRRARTGPIQTGSRLDRTGPIELIRLIGLVGLIGLIGFLIRLID